MCDGSEIQRWLGGSIPSIVFFFSSASHLVDLSTRSHPLQPQTELGSNLGASRSSGTHLVRVHAIPPFITPPQVTPLFNLLLPCFVLFLLHAVLIMKSERAASLESSRFLIQSCLHSPYPTRHLLSLTRMAALESCSEPVGVGRRHSGAQCRRTAGAGVYHPAALC